MNRKNATEFLYWQENKHAAKSAVVPTVAVGCMRIADKTETEAAAFIDTALSHGANFFDHADIYAGGNSETLFGKAMKAWKREELIVRTKCGIVPGVMYDFSYDHIMASVEGSLKRLDTDYIDVLLLHRPDALMESEEVARLFRCHDDIRTTTVSKSSKALDITGFSPL